MHWLEDRHEVSEKKKDRTYKASEKKKDRAYEASEKKKDRTYKVSEKKNDREYQELFMLLQELNGISVQVPILHPTPLQCLLAQLSVSLLLFGNVPSASHLITCRYFFPACEPPFQIVATRPPRTPRGAPKLETSVTVMTAGELYRASRTPAALGGSGNAGPGSPHSGLVAGLSGEWAR